MIDFGKIPVPDAPGRKDEMAVEPRDPGAVVDLNLDGARRVLRLFEDEVALLEGAANAIDVKTPAAAANATEMTGQIKRLAKAVDERRKEIIAEPDSFVRKVNGFVKPISDRLKALEALLKRKLSDHAYQVELQRREIERRQIEANRKLQEDLNREASEKGIAPVQVAPVAVSTRKEPTRSDSAVASSVMVWDFEVQDDTKVPRAYMMVDERLIRDAIRAGIREIPGVKIFERAEIRVRRVG